MKRRKVRAALWDSSERDWVRSTVEHNRKRRGRILWYVKTHENLTYRQLGQIVGLSHNQVYALIREAS